MKMFKLRKFDSFSKKKEEEVRDPVPVEHHPDDPPPERVQEGRGQEEQAHAGQRLRRRLQPRHISSFLHMFCVQQQHFVFFIYQNVNKFILC